MYQRLLVDRNRNWLPKLDALFARPAARSSSSAPPTSSGRMACWRCSGRRATRSNSCEPLSDTTSGGRHVLVAGAGLAGLAAARDLSMLGADVTVDRRARPRRRPRLDRARRLRRGPARRGRRRHDRRGPRRDPQAGKETRPQARRGFCAAALATSDPTRPASRAIVSRDARAAGTGLADCLGESLSRLPAGRTALGLPDRRRHRPTIGRAVARRCRAPTPSCGRPPRACADSSWRIPRSCRSSRSSISLPSSTADGPVPRKHVPDRGRQRSPARGAGGRPRRSRAAEHRSWSPSRIAARGCAPR